MFLSGGLFLLARRHYAPHCERIDSETVTPDRCPRFRMIPTGEDQTFFRVYRFIAVCSQQWSGKRTLAKTFQIERVIISAFSVFVVKGHLQHAGAGCKVWSCLCYHAYSIPSHVSHKDPISFEYDARFSIRLGAIYPTDDDDDDDFIASSEILL